jgi:hypothetical protein
MSNRIVEIPEWIPKLIVWRVQENVVNGSNIRNSSRCSVDFFALLIKPSQLLHRRKYVQGIDD